METQKKLIWVMCYLDIKSVTLHAFDMSLHERLAGLIGLVRIGSHEALVASFLCLGAGAASVDHKEVDSK